jgi:hypothetical protein
VKKAIFYIFLAMIKKNEEKCREFLLFFYFN